MKTPRLASSYRAARRKAAKLKAKVTGLPFRMLWPSYILGGHRGHKR